MEGTAGREAGRKGLGCPAREWTLGPFGCGAAEAFRAGRRGEADRSDPCAGRTLGVGWGGTAHNTSSLRSAHAVHITY